MKIAYCTTLLPPEKKFTEKTKYKIPGIALHKFSSGMIEGIEYNLEKDDSMTVFAITNVINYPRFPQLIFKNEKWSHADNNEDYYLGYVNIIGIKYITQAYNLYKNLNKWVKSLGEEKGTICVYNIFFPVMYAALKIKKKYKNKVKLCLITGDMVKIYNLKSNNKHTIKQILIDKLENYIFEMVKRFDSFVFATKDMAEAYEVNKKPYTIIEGLYVQNNDEDKSKVDISNKANKKIIFYAGSVRKEYGIEHLLNAFSLIKNENYELWIAGGGNCEELVQQRAKQDKRIKYYGFISPKKVDELTSFSTILINPRLATGNEYVKYSFPSKTMDGLASGKPFIAHDLPCYSDEYRKYIQIPDNESDQSLSEKIIEICELSDEKRDKISLEARQFILKEKNPKILCKKIVDMCEGVLNENET